MKAPLIYFYTNMKIIEKIAIIWVAPLFLAAIIALGAISTIIYLMKLLWVYSGTAGASIMIINQIRKKFNAAKWQRLQQTDRLMAEIDRKIKYN